LARRSRRPSTRETYGRLLNDLTDVVGDQEVTALSLEDYERFLDRWTNAAPSTLATGVSLVRGFSRFLWERGVVERHVADPLKRPKRQRPEDLEVVTVSRDDVARMLDVCSDWQELLCILTAAYPGARRRALARVRLTDLNLVGGTIRFVEKGGKVAVKPMPDEYRSRPVSRGK
jgi:integrase